MTALWLSTGTAANSLALAALCPPHGAIVCHREAHIGNDERGVPGACHSIDVQLVVSRRFPAPAGAAE